MRASVLIFVDMFGQNNRYIQLPKNSPRMCTLSILYAIPSFSRLT